MILEHFDINPIEADTEEQLLALLKKQLLAIGQHVTDYDIYINDAPYDKRKARTLINTINLEIAHRNQQELEDYEEERRAEEDLRSDYYNNLI